MARTHGIARLPLIVGVLVLGVILLLAFLFTHRSTPEPVTDAAIASAASASDLPATALTSGAFAALARLNNPDGTAWFGDLPETAASPSAGPEGLPTPQAGQSAGPSIPASTSPDDDPALLSSLAYAPPVDKAQANTTLFLDGWSVAAMGTSTIDVTTPDMVGGTIVLHPLSAQQIRNSLADDPEAIATYLARMYTSASAVKCTKDGCTVDGKDVDPGVLADPASIPGLGDVYKGSGVTHGLYAARVYVPKENSTLNLSANGFSGSVSPADFIDNNDKIVERPATSETGFKKGSWALSAGLGRIFPNDPAWIWEKPRIFDYDATYYTPSAVGLDKAYVGPVLISALTDAKAAPLVKRFSSSQMSYYTSPTTGCGTTILCVVTGSDVQVSNLKNQAAEACLFKPTDPPYGRAVLLNQTAHIKVRTPGPVLLMGAWDVPKGTGVLGTDISGATPKEGPYEFDQQSVFALDESGIRDIAAARNMPVKPIDDDQWFGGAFVSCDTK